MVLDKLLQPSGLSVAPPGAGKATRLSDEERAMCARMNITEDELLESRASLQTSGD